ncbi:GntR family transcriptional regulator [Streptomyces cinereoruber]|uniref:GntR family transcriptional regulator n=1 Tax=Streptomyces cinereoruber TaxID=67260 RepID=UPI003680234A
MIVELRTASTQGAEPASGSMYHRLREELVAMSRIREHDGVAEVLRLMTPWLPTAQDLLEATGSPSDRERWRRLVEEAQKADRSDFVAVSTAARILLRALLEASRPGPSVEEIADRLRRGIADGAYPPGSVLSRVRILRDVGLTKASESRADRAFQDLVAEGLITISLSKRVQVAGQGELPDQLALTTELLRALVVGGVYPPMSSLPTRPKLSQALATEKSITTRALRQLHDEGFLSVHRSAGSVVRPVAPVPVSAPPALEVLVGRLRSAASSGAPLTPADIRANCRSARAWWRQRSAPPAESLRRMRQVLVATAADLLPLAACRHPDDPSVHAVLRRTAVVALYDWPAELRIEVWRLACLATAVLEVLDLAGGAA